MAERKVSELFVNCREYLADSFPKHDNPTCSFASLPGLCYTLEMTVLPEILAAVVAHETHTVILRM